MNKSVVFIFVLLTWAAVSVADVKYASTSTMNLEGTAGTMMKFFGAGKPIKSVDYYKDDLKRSDTFDKNDNLETSQIIDLKSELFVTINHKEKEYHQMTFDEWKKQIEATLEQLDQEKREATDTTSTEPENTVDWQLTLDVQETGEKETIAGKNTEKVVLTLNLDAEVTSEEEAGQEPESARGGIIVTSTHWLYKGDDKAKQEMDDFHLRLAEKLGLVPGSANATEMPAKIVELNPQLGEAMETIQKAGEKLAGLSMRIETLYESKVDPETAQKMEQERVQQDENETTEMPTSVGGLLGGFGKKIIQKRMEKKNAGTKERNALMSSTTEVLELEISTLDETLFVVPAGYKLVEQKMQE